MEPKTSHSMTLGLTALLAAGLAFTPLVRAQQPGPTWRADHDDWREADRYEFRAIDRNGDGRIQRDEWRDSEASFRQYDVNRDGVLSGTEVRAALGGLQYDDFREIDRDRDGYLSRAEWRWDRAEFDRRDDNRDGRLSRSEYLDSWTGSRAPDFRDYDRNNDGRISRTEWRQDSWTFNRLDDDRDGYLTRTEFLNSPGPGRNPDFRDYDRDGNGTISRAEWNGDSASFNRMDLNRNGVISRDEFLGQPGPSPYPQDRFARFNALDDDRNGRISRREWNGERREFDLMDDDNDDSLSRDEFLEISRDERMALFAKADLDRDGGITRKEWRGDRDIFLKLDANHNGIVNRDEFVVEYRGLDRHFRSLDNNYDGLVSRTEWRDGSRSFNRYDDDRNGQLTFDEYAGII